MTPLFLTVLLLVNSVIFSGEIVLTKVTSLELYGYDMAHVMTNHQISKTKHYDDVQENDFLILRLREVCSQFNTLIQNSKNVQRAIGLGNISQFIPFYLHGLPQ